MKRIAVFSGSSPGVQPDSMIAAKRLAETLVSRSHALVYGGANVGLMGELARSVKALGGEVIGVIPRSLVEKEVAYRELHDLRIVESMHERKAVIANLSDGFVAMPCGLLNIAGYWNTLLAFLDHAVGQRFIKDAHRSMVFVADDPERLLDKFRVVSTASNRQVARP